MLDLKYGMIQIMAGKSNMKTVYATKGINRRQKYIASVEMLHTKNTTHTEMSSLSQLSMDPFLSESQVHPMASAIEKRSSCRVEWQ